MHRPKVTTRSGDFPFALGPELFSDPAHIEIPLQFLLLKIVNAEILIADH